GCPAEEITYSPVARSSDRCTAVTKPSLAPPRRMYALQAGRNSSLGTEPSRPPKAPESSSALVPASMPLPETSTSATSSILPSQNDTTKSPPNDEPPAGLSTRDDPHPSPSSGSLPWARM